MFGHSRIPEVQAHEVAADACFLDVREDEEWRAGHIEGALHIPLMTLPQRLADLPDGREVVVVCRVGGRSAQAVQFLVQQGTPAVNLGGGMMAWAAAGRAMVAADPTADAFVA